MLEIPVELGPRRYTVSVGHGLSRLLPDLLEGLRGRKILLVSSRRVAALHGRGVERSLRALGPVHVVLVPDGERFKSRSTLETLYDALLEARLGRDGLVVAFGGGVVGDLAGFAAATWMRGVDWVGIPTTLLSMVDSSIGGKVGINHAKAKNMIGAFHQPRAVVIDPSFLATLPVRAAPLGRLRDPQVRDPRRPRALRVDARGPGGPSRLGPREPWRSAIATACRIKAEVVEKDEREGGLRRVLNLGHTIGHALEAVTRYRRFTHGEAVGWGTDRRRLRRAPAGPAAARRASTRSPRRSTTSGRGRAVSDLPGADSVLEALSPGQEGEGRARALRPAHGHRPGGDRTTTSRADEVRRARCA